MSATEPGTVLERRYRSLLRVLPAGYRARWADEMTSTFLDSVETEDAEDAEYLADHGWPGRSEVASVLALAVRLRLGGVGAPPRPRLLGDAVRLVGLIGLLGQAVFATIGVANLFWLTGRIPALGVPQEDWVAKLTTTWFTVPTLLGCCSIVGYVALVLGRYRLAKALAGLALAASVALSVVSQYTVGPLSVSLWTAVLAEVALFLTLLAFHDEAPPVSRRPWLVSLPVGILIMVGVVLATQHTGGRILPMLDWAGLWCVAVATACAVHLGRGLLSRVRPPGRWSLALGLLALVGLGQRLVTMPEYLRSGAGVSGREMLTMGIVEIAVLVAVGVPLAVLVGRAYRRLGSPERAYLPRSGR